MSRGPLSSVYWPSAPKTGTTLPYSSRGQAGTLLGVLVGTDPVRRPTVRHGGFRQFRQDLVAPESSTTSQDLVCLP